MSGSPLGRPAMLAVGVALLLVTAAAAFHTIDRARTRLLAGDAEQTALGHAELIAGGVPGLTRLLVGRRLDETTLGELRRLERFGDVFRFKLFDREGRQLLVSDDLEAGNPLASPSSESLGAHHGDDSISAIVLGGENHVSVKDGRAKPDRPDVYVEAYVPLVQDGELIGVIEVYVDQTARAARVDLAFLWVGGTVGLLIALIALLAGTQTWLRARERRRSEATIRYMAEHDPLSGALNRPSFTRALEVAARRHERGGAAFSVLCIDLDRFKEVNDTLGHAAGDEVLREVTRRLRSLVRADDPIARLGGDEFAILLVGVTEATEVERRGRMVVDALSEPVDAAGQRAPCGASVGAARFGHDTRRVEELLHKADLAMYRSKSDGRGRFSFYDPELDHALELRRRMTLELRSALADDTLSAHFQPLYSSDSPGEPVGYEALMRWEHPTRGMVPPSEFIPLAEETGLITELGDWMLRTACTEAASWPGELYVAVNLSAAQFRGRTSLATKIGAILEETGLAPERLELEITESLLMGYTDDVLDTLVALADMGVRIALDDFGTGYSSLSYLWRFPFHKVKIDRSFTQRLEDDEKVGMIVRSIVTLAHSMGIRVNAEGVETEVQRLRLHELGCDELQGYLLGRPAPLDARAHGRKAA